MTDKQSLTATAKRPARLDIIDMPRDTNRCLGSLRQAICASFNYCRNYPDKLKVFIEVMEYVLQRAKEYGTPEAAEALAAVQAAEHKAKFDALITERNDVATAAAKVIKDVAQADLKYAQGLTVLEELSEYILTNGYEVVGETLEDVLAEFIKARTAKYKADAKQAKDAVIEQYAERVAAYNLQEAAE